MRNALKAVVAAVIPAILIVTADFAAAQTVTRRAVAVEPPKGAGSSTSQRPELFGSATIFSDHRSQGFTSNDQDPVLQLDGGVIWRNFYVGLSGSNVDLGTITQGGVTQNVGDYAVTYYGGYVNSWRGWDWDVAVSYNTYPGARDSTAELDYWEFSAGVSKIFFRDIKNGLRVYWSPDYTANQGDNWVLEFSSQKPLPEFRGWKPSIETVTGYQFGDEGRGNFDYWFWEVGLVIAMSEHFSIDLRYHDTADVPIDCDDLCGARFVASATLEF